MNTDTRGQFGGGRIYLRESEGLIPLVEAPYDAEAILQELLAEYPDLLAGDQMRPEEPRRWLLISREAGIPDADGAAARWSLDHLFVDQDAVPTLVEVKRSTDTRLRREVVGQMLDYAANVVAHWPAGQLRHILEERLSATADDADEKVLDLLQSKPTDPASATASVDAFWERAAGNLAAHRLRLVFVADIIPPELQRIVEFLNESLVRIEVLALEVKQYVGAGRQTLVPRIIGRTAAADDVKRGSAARVSREWTEVQFVDAVEAQGSPDALAIVRATLDWNRHHRAPITFGRGKTGPVYFIAYDREQRPVKIANVEVAGRVQIQYDNLLAAPPFDNPDLRLGLNARLNAIPGVAIKDHLAVNGSWPGIPRGVLDSADHRKAFLEAMDWVATTLAAG